MSGGPGIFVSVDGPNGAGKSTLIQAIERYLSSQGLRVLVTKEVSNSSLGNFIRKHHRDYAGETLALLVAADRCNHVEREIIPGLASWDVVITDRYVDSSLVFQRLDGVDMAFIWKINERFPKPNLSVVVTASPEVIVERMRIRETLDRFEATFNPAQEVRMFEEAAAFMEAQGFNVYRFDNSHQSVEFGATTVSSEILKSVGSRSE